MNTVTNLLNYSQSNFFGGHVDVNLIYTSKLKCVCDPK